MVRSTYECFLQYGVDTEFLRWSFLENGRGLGKEDLGIGGTVPSGRWSVPRNGNKGSKFGKWLNGLESAELWLKRERVMVQCAYSVEGIRQGRGY